MNAPRPFVWLVAISLAALAHPARSAGFADAAQRSVGHFREVTVAATGGAGSASASTVGVSPTSIPPKLPAVQVPGVPTPDVAAATPQATPRASATIIQPDLPAVVVGAAPPPTRDPEQTGTLQEPVAPLPAPVTILPSDVLAGAIEIALGNDKAKLPRRFSHKDREALATFYRSTRYHPIWIEGGAWTEKARAVVSRLQHADEDGLNASDYAVPEVAPGSGSAMPAELALSEIRLSASAALYARDAWGGRVDPMRISALIARKIDPPTADGVLGKLSGASDPAAVLEDFNPAYPGYLALKAKLAELTERGPSTPSARLRPMHGPVLATQAIAVLDDGPPLGGRVEKPEGSHLVGDLIANMERWRWLPHDVPSRYVAVNVPEFQLRVIDHGRVVHEARVITGKPEAPTPIFSDEIAYAIVNPSWYIPPSIMKKEILPGLAADPNYAAKRGYQVIRHGGSISVRQPPGERNALGFIKFMFPNNYAVYLHDTPNRNLFHASRRAFSHGCVRVDDPFALADEVLGSAWSEARLRRLIGHGERTIRLPEKLPVQLTYFTTVVDAFGEVRNFEDLYGYNRKLRAALDLPQQTANRAHARRAAIDGTETRRQP